MMIRYDYVGIRRLGILFSQFGGVLSMIVFSAFAGFWFYSASMVPPSEYGDSLGNDPRLTGICLGIFTLAVTWIAGSAIINAYPSIWIGKDAINVSVFLFFRVEIPWSQVVDFRFLKFHPGYILVRTKRLTPFHRVYGWMYSRSVSPSFLIGKDIDNYDALLRELRMRVKQRF